MHDASESRRAPGGQLGRHSVVGGVELVITCCIMEERNSGASEKGWLAPWPQSRATDVAKPGSGTAAGDIHWLTPPGAFTPAALSSCSAGDGAH